MENYTIKGAIFDMDGLMLDTEKLFVKFWIKAAADYGYNMTKEHVLSIRSLSRKYSEPKLKGIFGEEFNFENVRSQRIKLMNSYIDENGLEVKKGLFSMLNYLKTNKIKIAVATATGRDRAELYLDRIGVLEYFDATIYGDMVENGKPAPDIYLAAVAKLNLNPSECVAFEDSPNGLKSASAAGCKTIMIPDLTQPDDEIEPFLNAVYSNLEEAIDYFERRIRK